MCSYRQGVVLTWLVSYGFHTTWTTHRQNGDNLIILLYTLGTYRARVFCIVCADKGKRGYPRCEEFPQNSPVTRRIFWCVSPIHTNYKRTYTHTHTRAQCPACYDQTPLHQHFKLIPLNENVTHVKT